MAKKSQNGDGEDTQEDGNGPETVMIITRANFRDLVGDLAGYQDEMDSTRGKMGALVKDAVKDHNVHKRALALVRSLKKLTSQRRAEFRFHLDRYWKHMGWDAQADLFRAADEPSDQAEAPQEAAGEPAGEPEGEGGNVTPMRRTVDPETPAGLH